MPNLIREDIDSQNAILKVVIGKEDYETTFKDELKKIRSTANIKGFRKGKTPINFLKKMYGKNLLHDIVTKMLQEELAKEVNAETSNYLGQPIPVKDQPPVDFEVNDLIDYEFKFEVGTAPDFEVKGVDGSVAYDFYKAEVPGEKIDEQINLLKRQKGERILVEDDIQEEDIVTLKAKELENGEPKEDGWETTFSVIVTRLEDEIKKEILKKKKGDTVRFNIYKLEKDAKPDYVKKYLLYFTDADIEEGTETNEEYEATIEEVKRLIPAELTPEIFAEMFPDGGISNEQELRDLISLNIAAPDETLANSILYNDMRKKLLEINKPDMPLPEGFLKRWVEVAYDKESEAVLNNFEDFADDMRWTLIKNKLFKKYGFQIDEADVREAARSRIMGYFGGQMYPGMEDMLDKLVNKSMEDPNEVQRLAGEVLSNKLFFKLKEEVTLNEVPVSSEDLAKKMQELEEENKAARAKFDPAATEEEE